MKLGNYFMARRNQPRYGKKSKDWAILSRDSKCRYGGAPATGSSLWKGIWIRCNDWNGEGSRVLSNTRWWAKGTVYSLSESSGYQVNGQADFSRKVTCLISRNGDLIHRMYVRVELDDVTITQPSGTNVNAFRWVDWVGEVLIKNVELECGGQRIFR